MALGHAIAYARYEQHLSLRELARLSGVSNGQISNIETGRVKDPSFSVVAKLAKALRLSLNRLGVEHLDAQQ